MNEIAVVTAVIGGYDHIGHHKFYREDVDYIFYTDGKSLPKDDIWEPIILENPNNLSYRRLAKIPKLNPHSIERLNQYRYVIWIDGSMQIIGKNFVEEVLSYMDVGLVLSPHFDGRDCGYGEATIKPPKYRNEPLDEQCAAYREEGFPEHFGLYECGLQARDMSVPIVKEFGKIWLEQIMKWSVQDQVSCGYSLWKTGLKPDVLPQSFRYMNWVHINAHRREEV